MPARLSISLFVGVCALGIALLTIALNPAPSVAARKCVPYEFIGARGSGQDAKDDEFGMGPEIHDLYTSLSAWLPPGTLAHYGVPYPAVGVADVRSLVNGVGAAAHVGILGKYTDSVQDGQHAIEDRMRLRDTFCPDTKFVLAGYSQGAQAVGNVLENQSSALHPQIVAAVLFGDPYFNAGSWSARSDHAPDANGFLGVRGEWPESLHGRVFSYCHYHDIICNDSELKLGHVYVRNYADLGARKKAHVSPAYESLRHHGHGDPEQAARDVARVLGVQLPSASYPGPLDVAFAIDSTGSMVDEIEQVEDNVASLVGEISHINPDFRVALVDYKDSPDEESAYQARVDTPFTNNIASFETSLHSLQAVGGGDTPESVYAGVMTALGLDWRAGAKKMVIQLGDAAPKNPEPVTGFTLHDVQQRALAVDPATVDTIQSGDDPAAAAAFAALAAATGGNSLALPSEDLSGLVPAIVADVRNGSTAPTASIQVPSHALAGRPLVLAAVPGPDTEAIAAYEWDFNGDGVFDATTPDPVFQYTYPAPFSGIVALRVRAASGIASTATAPILVGSPPARAPGKPRRLKLTRKGSMAVLRWHAGRGPAPVWFTVLDAHGRALLRVDAASLAVSAKRAKKPAYKATLRGLSPYKSYAFSVSAGNDRGLSAKAGPVKAPAQHHQRRHRRN